MNQLI